MRNIVVGIWLGVIMIAITTGCMNKPATAHVPGTINSTDAYAGRVLEDSAAAIIYMKTWETCSDQNFPASVTFDNATHACDKTNGPFPAKGRKPLFDAEGLYGQALAAGQAYHAGVSADAAGLVAALTKLTNSITTMMSAGGI